MTIKDQIEKRKSIREYRDKKLSEAQIGEIRDAFVSLPRLTPDTDVEIAFFTENAARMEGVAGYRGNAFGAPAYIVILSEPADFYVENAGFIGEGILLKLTDMGLDCCWLTIDNSEAVKSAALVKSDKEAVAVIACGYGKKERSKKRFDIKSPSSVDFTSREGHVAPKIALSEMVYLKNWGKEAEWDPYAIDPMLEDALYCASLAPSFLNRQPYRYVVQQSRVILYVKNEELTSDIDTLLDAGATIFNFYASYTARVNAKGWSMGAAPDLEDVNAPDQWTPVAYFEW